MNRGREGDVPEGTTVIRKAVRSVRLQVRPDGTLRVVAPPSFDVGGFLQRNAAWIDERREEFDRMAAEGRGKEDQLLLHGRFYRPVPGARFSIDETRETVAFPSVSALRRDLSGMLKEETLVRLKTYPDLTGPWSGRIAVKLQTTRWGSCSSLGERTPALLGHPRTEPDLGFSPGRRVRGPGTLLHGLRPPSGDRTIDFPSRERAGADSDTVSCETGRAWTGCE
jgi:hypothetical protein